MSFQFDPYLILGIKPTSDSDMITQAYQTLVSHLQSNPIEAAHVQLEMVEKAYNILNNPVKRKDYHTYLDSQNVTAQNTSRFSLRLTPSKRDIKPLSEEQVVYVLAEIFAPHGVTKMMDEREIRLNLTLVIDQSKSMDDGGRMKRVIAAAQTIISDLTENDIISVVSFNDRATTVIDATKVTDTTSLRTRVSMIQPRGGTEIYQGLKGGVAENRKFLDTERINHIILLTDGRTYGDEDDCLNLAREVAKDGISISAMGLGSEWNDKFLDQLVALTGGTSTYIKSVNMVSNFMEQHLRQISNAFAERMTLSIVTNPNIKIEMAFKISPHPQPLAVEGGIIPLASLQAKRPISVLLQLQLPANMKDDFIHIGHFVASGDLMLNQAQTFYTVADMDLSVKERPEETSPATSIVDALSKLTLYRLQEKAQLAMENGDIDEATRHLQYLATRLIDMGENELGQQAMAEAQYVQQTRAFSTEDAKKTIKYQTRALIEPSGIQSALTALLDDE